LELATHSKVGTLTLILNVVLEELSLVSYLKFEVESPT